MDLLRKLIRSLARQIKEVKETAMGNNVPEAAVIREPVKEYVDEETAAERQRMEEGDDDRENRVHFKTALSSNVIFQNHSYLFIK